MTVTPLTTGLFLTGGVVAFVNGVAFWMFYLDKERAIRGEWRISETTLLTLAFLGGWFGAIAAQRRFRHKTRKQPFRTFLNLIPFLWGILGFAFAYETDLMNLRSFFASQ